jgi:hypothetical protein
VLPYANRVSRAARCCQGQVLCRAGSPPNPAGTFRCTRLSSDLCRVRGGFAVVDVLVAGTADDERLAPLLGHESRPPRLAWTGLIKLSQLADLMHLHLAGFLAKLAPAPSESCDELLAGVGHRSGRDAVGEDRVPIPREGDSTEPCDQWLLAGALNAGFEAGPGSMPSEPFRVTVGYCG